MHENVIPIYIGHVQGVLEHSCPDADQQVAKYDKM
jgi:hypothetical protein